MDRVMGGNMQLHAILSFHIIHRQTTEGELSWQKSH